MPKYDKLMPPRKGKTVYQTPMHNCLVKNVPKRKV